MFPVNQSAKDSRIHPKRDQWSLVYVKSAGEGRCLRPTSLLQEQPTYRHEFDGAEHVVTLREDGTVSLQRGI